MRKELTCLYITFPDFNSAEKLSNMLLSAKLVACTHILPVNSMYFWKESLMNEEELVVIGKTLPAKLEEIELMIIIHHSYEIPLIGSWSMEVNESYYDWVRTQLEELC